MEQQVLLSAQELLAHLESIKNKDEVCLRTPIQVFVANIINQTLFGFSYKYDKCERLMSVVDEITEVFKELKASKLTLIGQAFPAIYRLPFVGYMAKDRIHNMLSGTRRLIIEDCERALKSYSPDQEPECLVQAAAINELQRRANIVQQNATHRTVKETSVGGFKIPADTLVLGDIHHVLGYSPIYKDAHEFRPERFLMDDGITANTEAVEQLCPFSIGKRQCAGEALARVELFIGVVTLLQHYKIEPAKAHPIDLEPIPAVALFPKEQPLRLVPLTH
ncbi:unnamed protein product [Nippostrongylus brasiliensis]|uniref:Cytochrome P450 n=1 Tax=Nippostrongylus brasiliensis TaxID=27835 RepID=A0A0N4Y5W8_NIPBR|nr:unnamed protein product [Nippostrongylus brasiliensis]